MSMTRYPLDFDALDKGSVITREQVAEISGVPPDDQRFGFAVLHLRQRIEQELAARGRVLTLKTEDGGIRVLTDGEASQYNAEAINKGIAKMYRAHVRNMHVDAGLLNEKERRTHERRLEVGGRYVQAITQTRAELKCSPVRRSLPGLPEK